MRSRIPEIIALSLALLAFCQPLKSQDAVDEAYGCLTRLTGIDSRTIFSLTADTANNASSWFTIRSDGRTAHIKGSDAADIVRGAYALRQISRNG